MKIRKIGKESPTKAAIFLIFVVVLEGLLGRKQEIPPVFPALFQTGMEVTPRNRKKIRKKKKIPETQGLSWVSRWCRIFGEQNPNPGKSHLPAFWDELYAVNSENTGKPLGRPSLSVDFRVFFGAVLSWGTAAARRGGGSAPGRPGLRSPPGSAPSRWRAPGAGNRSGIPG